MHDLSNLGIALGVALFFWGGLYLFCCWLAEAKQDGAVNTKGQGR